MPERTAFQLLPVQRRQSRAYRQHQRQNDASGSFHGSFLISWVRGSLQSFTAPGVCPARFRRFIFTNLLYTNPPGFSTGKNT